MSGFTGFVSAAMQLGSQAIVIKPTRGIYGPQYVDGKELMVLPDIIANAVTEEVHHDEMDITEHPVEQGSAIADHAFKRPAELVLKMAWSNSPQTASMLNAALGFGAAQSRALRNALNVVNTIDAAASLINGAQPDQIKAIYQQLLELQTRRALFVVYTGKRVYTNMMCRSLSVENDYKTENALFVTMHCKQLILVNTETVVLQKNKQANPASTASVVSKGKQSLKPSRGPQ